MTRLTIDVHGALDQGVLRTMAPRLWHHRQNQTKRVWSVEVFSPSFLKSACECAGLAGLLNHTRHQNQGSIRPLRNRSFRITNQIKQHISQACINSLFHALKQTTELGDKNATRSGANLIEFQNGKTSDGERAVAHQRQACF